MKSVGRERRAWKSRGGLLIFDDDALAALAGGAFELTPIMVRLVRLYANKPHLGTAVRAIRSLNSERLERSKSRWCQMSLPLLQAGALLVSQPSAPVGNKPEANDEPLWSSDRQMSSYSSPFSEAAVMRRPKITLRTARGGYARAGDGTAASQPHGLGMKTTDYTAHTRTGRAAPESSTRSAALQTRSESRPTIRRTRGR